MEKETPTLLLILQIVDVILSIGSNIRDWIESRKK